MNNITLDTTMADILAAFPQAKVGLFQKYHIGGCKSCAYDPTDTLAKVRENHSISDSLEQIVEVIQKSGSVEASLHITLADFKTALDKGTEFQILDARTVIDYEDGHLPGAKFITVELQFEALDEWEKDTPIVVYSNRGERSLARASHFKAYGLTNVRSLDGGFEAWQAAGFPVSEGLDGSK